MSLRGSLRILQHLLGRNVRRRSHREPELLGQQIREPVVAGQAEVDQHRVAGVAKHHVARLEVEVDDVLAVERVEGARRSRLPMRAASSASSGARSICRGASLPGGTP